MLKIKLSPRGKKHQITYRIIVAPDRSKFDGKYTDNIGFYNPHTKEIKVDKDKLSAWIKNGAKLTDGVGRLLEPSKYPPKKKKDRSKKEETKSEPKIEPETEVKTEETVKTEPVTETQPVSETQTQAN